MNSIRSFALLRASRHKIGRLGNLHGALGLTTPFVYRTGAPAPLVQKPRAAAIKTEATTGLEKAGETRAN